MKGPGTETRQALGSFSSNREIPVLGAGHLRVTVSFTFSNSKLTTTFTYLFTPVTLFLFSCTQVSNKLNVASPETLNFVKFSLNARDKVAGRK